jgi:alkanesulfonate monooxygenase SsuD/methylene tetrahydromethanopterin reductase-like flavin-dependent oxidoreductase (luciferase family)
VRHGVVILPEHSWPQAVRQWQTADRLGFDHAWTFDHLMWRWLRESSWFSAVPQLTAAAVATTRIRVGTLVANPDIRHPVTFAKECMTVDDISGGRLICGIGAGAGGFDGAAFGMPVAAGARRADRFAEFVELMDLLLRHEETTYLGTHYESHAVRMHPGCTQRPRVPFAIAATGPRGMRLAARHGQLWVTTGRPGQFGPQRFDKAAPLLAEQQSRLDEACAATGRDPATLDRMVVAGAQIGGVLASRAAFEDAEGLFAEMGFTDMVVFWPRPQPPFAAPAGILDEIAPLLNRPPATSPSTTPPPAAVPLDREPAAPGPAR